MNKKIVIMVFLLSFIKSFAYINIFPTTFDKRIDNEEGVQTFYISNNTKNPLSYRIYLEKSDSKKDMTEWIEIYPKSVKLDIGETKEVKMQILSPKGVEKGEYISNLVIKEIESPESKKKNQNTKVRIFTELKIEIAGFVGELSPKFEIKDNKIINIGEIRSKIEVFLSNKKENKYVGTLRMLPKDEKSLDDLKITSSDFKNYKYIELKDVDGNTILKTKLGE